MISRNLRNSHRDHPLTVLVMLVGFWLMLHTSGVSAAEYYDLRVYLIESAEKQEIVGDYLKLALVPALNRQGIDRVGVFRRQDDTTDYALYVLIPFSKLEQFGSLNDRLAADEEYQQAAARYFAEPKESPPYRRMESRFMKAFAGMPKIELPRETRENAPRMFELRLYESHNEDKARRKVAMFNNGEIDVMRESDMAPVFYGETLTGPDVPNLIYMLSASDQQAHQAHWKTFLAHPEWNRMKNLEQYKDTVSHIKKWFLTPLPYSQI